MVMGPSTVPIFWLLRSIAPSLRTVDATMRLETYKQVVQTGFLGHLDLELKPGKYAISFTVNSVFQRASVWSWSREKPIVGIPIWMPLGACTSSPRTLIG